MTGLVVSLRHVGRTRLTVLRIVPGMAYRRPIIVGQSLVIAKQRFRLTVYCQSQRALALPALWELTSGQFGFRRDPLVTTVSNTDVSHLCHLCHRLLLFAIVSPLSRKVRGTRSLSKSLAFTLVEHDQDVNEGAKRCMPFARLNAVPVRFYLQ